MKYEEKFLEAHDLHADAIFRYCFFQTSNREIAKDLSQDTFIKTWEYLTKGKKVANIQAFLYKVAKNLIIDYRRKKKTTSLDNILETGVEFEDAKNLQEEREAIFDGQKAIEVLDELDDGYREILILRYVNDLGVSEIAKLIKEKENTVSVRIHRGMDKLRKLLEEKT